MILSSRVSSCTLVHAPRAARGAEAAQLAIEGDECFVIAGIAGDPYETVRKDAAREVGIELFLHKARQRRARFFTLGEVGLRVRSHCAIQRRLFGAVAQVGALACGHRGHCTGVGVVSSILVLYTVFVMCKYLFLLSFLFSCPLSTPAPGCIAYRTSSRAARR